jgi:hypothetical protein
MIAIQIPLKNVFDIGLWTIDVGGKHPCPVDISPTLLTAGMGVPHISF